MSTVLYVFGTKYGVDRGKYNRTVYILIQHKNQIRSSRTSHRRKEHNDTCTRHSKDNGEGLALEHIITGQRCGRETLHERGGVRSGHKGRVGLA